MRPCAQGKCGGVLAIRAGIEEAMLAADAASAAFQTWRQTTAHHRCALLRAWYNAVIEHTEGIARTITMEMGKPIQEARGEVVYAASFIDWFAEEGRRVGGESMPSQHGNKRLATLQQPVGPVYAITPWNFPAAMITRKLAPALFALAGIGLMVLAAAGIAGWEYSNSDHFCATVCHQVHPEESIIHKRPRFISPGSTRSM